MSGEASYFTTGLGGNHELRFGGGWRRVDSTSLNTYPGGGIQVRYNPTSRVRFHRARTPEHDARDRLRLRQLHEEPADLNLGALTTPAAQDGRKRPVHQPAARHRLPGRSGKGHLERLLAARRVHLCARRLAAHARPWLVRALRGPDLPGRRGLAEPAGPVLPGIQLERPEPRRALPERRGGLQPHHGLRGRRPGEPVGGRFVEPDRSRLPLQPGQRDRGRHRAAARTQPGVSAAYAPSRPTPPRPSSVRLLVLWIGVTGAGFHRGTGATVSRRRPVGPERRREQPGLLQPAGLQPPTTAGVALVKPQPLDGADRSPQRLKENVDRARSSTRATPAWPVDGAQHGVRRGSGRTRARSGRPTSTAWSSFRADSRTGGEDLFGRQGTQPVFFQLTSARADGCRTC